MESIILKGVAAGFVCFLLYFTDVIAEYGKKLGFSRFLRLEEYRKWKLDNMDSYYPYFLRSTYNSFWIRLIGCPFCLIAWISLPELIHSFSIYLWLDCAAFGSACFLILRLLYCKNYTK